MISAKNLSVSLAGSATARAARVATTSTSTAQTLDDLTFEIATGTWTAVLGPNGAGKSTLLRTLLGHQAHSGSLSVGADSYRNTHTSAGALNLNIAYVPQRPEIPAGITVSEYVALGRAPLEGWGRQHPNQAVVLDTLERLDLTQLSNRQLTKLSGGEAQRAVLARALVQEPDLLLLDEPTTGLDLHHKAAFFNAIKNAQAEGLTVVSSLHDLTAAAQYTQRALLLNQSRLMAQGTTSEVIQSPDFAAAFDNQIRVETLADGTLIVLPR